MDRRHWHWFGSRGFGGTTGCKAIHASLVTTKIKAVSDLTLDKLILQEAALGNF
jgi:hypothetical protein